MQKADFRAQKKRKSQAKVNRDTKIKTVLLLQRLLLILFSRAVFFRYGRKEPMISSSSTIHGRVFSSKGKGVPFGPTEDAVLPAVHSLTGPRTVRSFSSSQLQIPPRSSSGVGEERVDILKDEYFLTDNFMNMSRDRQKSLLKID